MEKAEQILLNDSHFLDQNKQNRHIETEYIPYFVTKISNASGSYDGSYGVDITIITNVTININNLVTSYPVITVITNWHPCNGHISNNDVQNTSFYSGFKYPSDITKKFIKDIDIAQLKLTNDNLMCDEYVHSKVRNQMVNANDMEDLMCDEYVHSKVGKSNL
jgi:hypothetical protein